MKLAKMDYVPSMIKLPEITGLMQIWRIIIARVFLVIRRPKSLDFRHSFSTAVIFYYEKSKYYLYMLLQ